MWHCVTKRKVTSAICFVRAATFDLKLSSCAFLLARKGSKPEGICEREGAGNHGTVTDGPIRSVCLDGRICFLISAEVHFHERLARPMASPA